MALQDILDAIIAQADQQIAGARSAHGKRLSQLREESERAIAKRKQEIALQKEERKTQIKSKAESHASMQKRNVLLQKKQDLLNRLYTETTTALAGLPAEKLEGFLQRCLKEIKGKGTLRPSTAHAALLKKLAPADQFEIGEPVDAIGGFLFQSIKEERDFTFDHLVDSALRPSTEVESAHILFA